MQLSEYMVLLTLPYLTHFPHQPLKNQGQLSKNCVQRITAGDTHNLRRF